MKQYGKDFSVLTRAKGVWKDLLNPKKYPPGFKVFTCSWSDFFHEGADQWRDEAWDTMRRRPDLTWQILTKRVDRIEDHLPHDWPWPNAWLGFTAENQARFDERSIYAERIPAALWFVSSEPLLGRIDMTERLGIRWNREARQFERLKDSCIGWVIAGGETGPKARPTNPFWVQSLKLQAVVAGVPFHFKSWGEWVTEYQAPEDIILPGTSRLPWAEKDKDGEYTRGDQTAVYKVGREKSGRLLDGVLWDQMPATPQGGDAECSPPGSTAPAPAAGPGSS